MLLRVPSGAVLEVEPPRLRAVLLRGGSDEALIDAVWMHQMDPDYLLPEDRSFVLSWAVEQLTGDDEATEFTAVCERFHVLPSQRLRVADPVLAYECDWGLTLALMKARKDVGGEGPDEDDNAGRVRFTTGGPEET